MAQASEVPPGTLRASDVLSCQYCGVLNRLDFSAEEDAYCGGCNSRIWRARSHYKWTLSLTVAALVFYVPANVFPILSMKQMGQYSESTILAGVWELAASGMWGVAVVVFVASVLVPLLKIAGLLFLCWLAMHGGITPQTSTRQRRAGLFMYKLIHLSGPWSMLDVFVVAVLVALVKLGELATVLPGPGLVAFSAVVVMTLIASQTFDPRHIFVAGAGRVTVLSDQPDPVAESGHSKEQEAPH